MLITRDAVRNREKKKKIRVYKTRYIYIPGMQESRLERLEESGLKKGESRQKVKTATSR